MQKGNLFKAAECLRLRRRVTAQQANDQLHQHGLDQNHRHVRTAPIIGQTVKLLLKDALHPTKVKLFSRSAKLVEIYN